MERATRNVDPGDLADYVGQRIIEGSRRTSIGCSRNRANKFSTARAEAGAPAAHGEVERPNLMREVHDSSQRHLEPSAVELVFGVRRSPIRPDDRVGIRDRRRH